MDPSEGTLGPVFLPVSAGRGGVRLRCLLRHAPQEPGAAILAFCRGIEVGRRPVTDPIAPGVEIDIPITRIPRVELPAELRFAAAPDGPDLAPPWPLPNAAASLALLGPPTPPRIERLRLEHGVIRGIAMEHNNGLLEPVMYARINEAGARGVVTEAPWPLPEGGCGFRFSLALEVGDLNESGLGIAFHLVGIAAPVAHYAYARTFIDAPAPQLAALEARVARLERDSVAMAATLREDARRHAALLTERTDRFIEAAAALLLDRLAGTASAVDSGEADPRLTALRGLIAEAAFNRNRPDCPQAHTGPAVIETAAMPALMGQRAVIPPGAGHLATGWHAAEEDDGGEFRWMGDRALVVNPEPHRPVRSVTLQVRHIYGADAPGLRGSFDGLPARVTCTRDGLGFTLRLEPEAAPDVACHGLSLAADHAGVPLHDGRNPDQRLLSIAVSLVAFDYADAVAPPEAR
jgi:hypothetical protein